MPEMPEVETIRRALNEENIIGIPIVKAGICSKHVLEGIDGEAFLKQMVGAQIRNVLRRGKFLIFQFQDFYLLIHLRMSGKIFLSKDAFVQRHEHIRLLFADQRVLSFFDPRKFGRVYFAKNIEEIVGKLGPEPLSSLWTFEDFGASLSRLSRKIKPLLLDQNFLAGLGNIYADEALWLAGIHPEAKAREISNTKKHSLYQAIKQVLQRGIRFGGTSLGTGLSNFQKVNGESGGHQGQLMIYGRQEEACFRCAKKIMKITVGGRGTYLCLRCQKIS